MAVALLWVREMGVTSTQDWTGRQLPLVTEPAWELGDGWLHATGPCLPGLTMAAQKNWKNMGMLAGVAYCRRSWKWGYRGRLPPGFKFRHGNLASRNHTVLRLRETHVFRQNHKILGLPLPHSIGSWKARGSSNAELSAVWKNAGEVLGEGKGWMGSCSWTMRRCHVGLD